MSRPRRVVVSDGSDGRSFVSSDEPAQFSFDAGPALMHQLWLTADTPVDPHRDVFQESGPAAPLAQPGPGGSLFQICTFKPGADSPMHKTNTIDYVVITSGAIDLETQEGATVKLAAGDCVIQRATVHRWVNAYDEPCTMVVTCISTTSNPESAVGIEVVE